MHVDESMKAKYGAISQLGRIVPMPIRVGKLEALQEGVDVGQLLGLRGPVRRIDGASWAETVRRT